MRRNYTYCLFVLVVLAFSFTSLYVGLHFSEVLNLKQHHELYSYEKSFLHVHVIGSPDADVDDSVAQTLHNTIRVFCWIMTWPKNFDTKATAVKKTWAKKFNKHIFISSVTDAIFPTVRLNISEGREHLTAKTMQGFKYAYDNYFNEADWFMKADDDTYVIVENLRYFLSYFDPNKPLYFGSHLRPSWVPHGYMSGGAGYVLSKEALRLLAVHGIPNKTKCRQDGGYEDVEMGLCLFRIGVKLMETRDNKGRETFHPLAPPMHIFGSYPPWLDRYAYNPVKKGYDCCSDYTISFHYVSPDDMYLLHFFIYHVRPYGIQFRQPSQPVFNLTEESRSMISSPKQILNSSLRN